MALLRVLQEGDFERVGGDETLHTDARVVAASNRNLEEAVREGRFRIRELQNVVERAVILASGHVLNVRDFELPSLQGEAGGGPLLEAVEDEERRRIEAALASSRGRVSGPYGAAKALGVAPSTLESRIQRLRIDKHAFRHHLERAPRS